VRQGVRAAPKAIRLGRRTHYPPTLVRLTPTELTTRRLILRALVPGLATALRVNRQRDIISVLELEAWVASLPGTGEKILAMQKAGSTLRDIALHLDPSISRVFSRLKAPGPVLADRAGLAVAGARPSVAQLQSGVTARMAASPLAFRRDGGTSADPGVEPSQSRWRPESRASLAERPARVRAMGRPRQGSP
jgi:hypothetical protein